MDSTIEMASTISALVSRLADKYGFDADEAMKMLSEPTTTSDEKIAEKIAECKKNISLWEKKLEDGKVKDVDKHREKIAKEKAKLEKLEKKTPAPEPVTEAPVEEAEKKVEGKPEAEKPAAKKPKATKKKKVEGKPETEKKVEGKPETKEKRIKRFSPVMTSQLKTALTGVQLDINDTLKKEFQQYIEDLTDDDFRANGLADHMRAFVNLKAPVKKMDPVVEELVEEIDKLTVEEGPSNAAGGGPKVHNLSLKELQSITFIATIDKPGIFWDADGGRFVKGPDADDDEDVTDIKFGGDLYAVGEKTGRVYEAHDSGDVFAGFCGVGKFKGMKMP
jgi:hypothetical protein